MSNWARGLLGAVAGGAKAYQKLSEEERVAKLNAQKDAALLKRQQQLYKFQNDIKRQEKLTDQAYEEELYDERLEDQRTYKEEQTEKKQKYQDEKMDAEYKLKENLLKIKADLTQEKTVSKLSERKYQEQQAFDSVKGYLKSRGAFWDSKTDKKEFILSDIDQKTIDQILKTLDNSGYTFDANHSDGELRIFLKDFNSDRISLNNAEKPAVPDVPADPEDPDAILDKYRSRLPKDEKNSVEAPVTLGQLSNGKSFGASSYGYMIQQSNGNWIQATPEEYQEIMAKARNGLVAPKPKTKITPKVSANPDYNIMQP